jgi:hypothetical protein
MRARRAENTARTHEPDGKRVEAGARRGLGAVGNGRIVAYGARSPARSAAQGHAHPSFPRSTRTGNGKRETGNGAPPRRSVSRLTPLFPHLLPGFRPPTKGTGPSPPSPAPGLRPPTETPGPAPHPSHPPSPARDSRPLKRKARPEPTPFTSPPSYHPILLPRHPLHRSCRQTSPRIRLPGRCRPGCPRRGSTCGSTAPPRTRPRGA